MEEISQSDASLICLQELDRIDDFYEAEFKKLGFNMVYGERTKREMANEYATDSSRHKEYRDFLIRFHTIAIAYKTDEWDLINYETIDFLDLKNWFPGVIEF